jgi:hypothetical protein
MACCYEIPWIPEGSAFPHQISFMLRQNLFRVKYYSDKAI